MGPGLQISRSRSDLLCVRGRLFHFFHSEEFSRSFLWIPRLTVDPEVASVCMARPLRLEFQGALHHVMGKSAAELRRQLFDLHITHADGSTSVIP